VLDVQTIQGRQISRLEIAEIQTLIQANPRWSRRRLSVDLALRWQWYAPSGQLKDMAARTLLLKLEARGLLTLPLRRRNPVRRALPTEQDRPESPPPEPVVAPLALLRPLQIQVLGPRHPDYPRFQRYLRQHHYLGYGGPIGENLAYLVQSGAGVDLACVLFGAAAWQCAPRDQWIGWSVPQRAQRLGWIANNSRFLILPWVRCAGLATQILAQIARRIDADWQRRYHHRLYLLESFVQADRFRGTCYQAANWIRVGQTTGRTRQNARHRDNAIHAPVKEVYLYALSPYARRTLQR
jgi:hypothetical protein